MRRELKQVRYASRRTALEEPAPHARTLTRRTPDEAAALLARINRLISDEEDGRG